MRVHGMVLTSVVVVLALLSAACSTNTGAGVATTTAATLAPAATTTTTVAPTTTPKTDTIDWIAVEDVATRYMLAHGDREVSAATALLDEAVFFDWGPNSGREGLAVAWAWEDAFTVVHTLERCEALSDDTQPIARCILRVDSEVAEAAGKEPGSVCVDITVRERLITSVVGQEPQPDCAYNYWSNMFQPFADWLAAAHPDTTVNLMYDDRVSPEGIELWRTYTDEYLADHSS